MCLPLFPLVNLPVLARVFELLALSRSVLVPRLRQRHAYDRGHEDWLLMLAGLWPSLLVLLEWRAFAGLPR